MADTDTPRTVAVVGAGTMGTGIAVVSARAGFRTLIHDVDETGLARGIDSVRGFLRKSAKKGKLTEEQAEAASEAVSGTTRLDDLAPADIVVEAVHEDLATKQQLFGTLDDIVAPETLLHTNTSTLPVTGIAAGSKLPERVVGTHYCNPAPLMKLVEVARGRRTDDSAYERTVEFLGQVGKTTVHTADRPGFIVNRFLIPWENDVIRALESGLGTIESIDRAVRGALGHPMGPFELLDIVGLDVHREVAMRLYEQFREQRFAPPPLVDQMIAAGDLGRKTGRGFYTYDDNRLFGT
ncbi:3-hydroxybutyryl-CoA dehydrogenase [Lipingzhangella halophila]|uniref:3-hydroxybutyryl-CoA dehydrogenase n=1 Tax=Lipingzhangella halophila TaxID=1783352 RepID=A0A7W7RNL0_9ACTN|nr:3-hydroxyacyl-CoA dehydrogenase family protein [Lipingzhangella halophila]MBB4935297.1 3-hydroxybutyryl-CoA dehydrogenase [Lipingzhangella halophila]